MAGRPAQQAYVKADWSNCRPYHYTAVRSLWHFISSTSGSFEPSARILVFALLPDAFHYLSSSSLQVRLARRTTMASNLSKRRRTDGEGDQSGTVLDNVKPVKLDHGMNARPSNSIPPPEHPRSMQEVALFHTGVDNGPAFGYGYKYSRLGAREFRLVRLHPGRGDEIPHCSLVVDNIDEASSYEALSYVWGDATITRQILLSDEGPSVSFSTPHLFNVTVNLYDALRHLRLPERPRILWVDALCINQGDISERNDQVAMMSKIYRQSHRVVVWLGRSDPATDFLLSNLYQAFKPGFFCAECAGEGTAQQAITPRITPSSIRKLLGRLLSNNWWSRAWVIQEIMLASTSTIMVGQRQVDWEDIRTAVELCEETCSTLPSQTQNSEINSSNMKRALRLLSARQGLWHTSAMGDIVEPRLPLADVLAKFHDVKASDPRDKVYALLSMARPDTVIDIDYNRTPSQVWVQTATAVIKERRSMDWIVPRLSPRSTTRELPSWAPDWSQESSPSHWSVSKTVNSRPIRQYNASGDSKMEVQFGPLISKNRRLGGQPIDIPQNGGEVDSLGEMGDIVLHAKGIRIGVITDLSTRIVDGLISRDALEMAGIPFTGGCESLRHIAPQKFTSLWKTLVADRDADGNPAPTRFGLALKHLFKRILQSRSLDIEEVLETEQDTNIRTFLEKVRATTNGQRLFTSTVNDLDEILLGHVPRGARLGDTIAILFGTSIPFILRESKLGKDYLQLIGPAYVDGIMDGEIFSKLSEDRVEDSFQII